MQCIFICMHIYGYEEGGKEKYMYTYTSPPSNSAEHTQTDKDYALLNR